MKFSKRGEYALRALIDLGVAREPGRPLISIRELSAKEKILVTFLEQTLFQLRAAGYVGGTRGIIMVPAATGCRGLSFEARRAAGRFRLGIFAARSSLMAETFDA